LEEGSKDIVSHELELVGEAVLDGGGEDRVEGEGEEMVISCSGVGSLSISGRRSSFHSAEEHEELEEDCIWWDICLVDECQGLVCDEHICQFRLDSRSDSMLVIIH